MGDGAEGEGVGRAAGEVFEGDEENEGEEGKAGGEGTLVLLHSTNISWCLFCFRLFVVGPLADVFATFLITGERGRV